MNKTIKKMTFSAVFIAMAVVLSWITFIIGGKELSTLLSPLHLMVFIAGMLLGWEYGLTVGILVPIVSSLVRGMPPFFPQAIGMAVELGLYGFISGLFSHNIKIAKIRIVHLYISLFIAMIVGRIGYGIFYTILYSITDHAWSFALFFKAIFLSQIPGIIIQIVLIPFLVLSLERILKL